LRDSLVASRPRGINTNISRTLSPVASTNALANLVRREKQVQPTTALTAPSLSETLWTHRRKARLISLAIRSRISLSTRGAVCGAGAAASETTIEHPQPFISLSMYLCCYWTTLGAKKSIAKRFTSRQLNIMVSVTPVHLSRISHSNDCSGLPIRQIDSSTTQDPTLRQLFR